MCLIVILGSGRNQSLVEYQKVTPHVNLNKFVVKIEINHSTDFNDFYPKTAQVGDPNYAGGSEGSGQPAVIYAAQIDRTSGQKQFQANMSARCAVGIGIGLSGYEKALVPLYGTVKFRITRPHPFTPFVEGAAGRAFALAKNAKGGFSLSPSVGMEIRLPVPIKMWVTIGYELQKLKRLKKQGNPVVSVAYEERVSHNSLTFKAGILF